MIRELDALLDYIDDEQRRAAKRLKDSGESPVAMSIATAAYESPGTHQKLTERGVGSHSSVSCRGTSHAELRPGPVTASRGVLRSP